ncbi:HNH endonuclease [Bacillus sp. AFS018417]|nr:HNH endonuclease [Bacillus sp. AFS018417]
MYFLLGKEDKIDNFNIAMIPIEDNENFPEGKEKERLHKYKERNPRVLKRAKENFKKENGKLYCEVCGFDFQEKYGELGQDFIEGHHVIPVSELNENDVTNINDILMVCSNCHRMLHKKRPCLTKEELQVLIK